MGHWLRRRTAATTLLLLLTLASACEPGSIPNEGAGAQDGGARDRIESQDAWRADTSGFDAGPGVDRASVDEPGLKLPEEPFQQLDDLRPFRPFARPHYIAHRGSLLHGIHKLFGAAEVEALAVTPDSSDLFHPEPGCHQYAEALA